MTLLTTLTTYLQSHPQPLKTPATALHLAQSAPALLASHPPDTPETWLLYETLLLACLLVSDDQSSRLLLDRLSDRFGGDSPRIKALSGIYEEATAGSKEALQSLLTRYEKSLSTDRTNIGVEKRGIVLLSGSLGRTEDAVKALVRIVDHSPTDAEAWAQLAELYKRQGMYQQAVFCLEEVLLIHPNAYNVHARIGELTYIMGAGEEDAIKWFCRSVELCEWYLRGWYGIRLMTGKMKGRSEVMETLHTKSGEKLKVIIMKSRKGETGWAGFDHGEVEAAEDLLNEI